MSHVVYIITKLELGGAQKVCLSLLAGMQENAATLITGTEGKLVAQVANNPNVILLKELTREVRFFGFLQEIKCLWALTQALRALKKKYPRIIVHTHSTKAGLLGRWAAFFAGIKTRVHTVHGYAFHEHQNKLVWLMIYCAELLTSFITTHYVCVSSADVKTGIKLFPWFASKHSIIRAATTYSSINSPQYNSGKAGQTVGEFSVRAAKKIEMKNFPVRPEVLRDNSDNLPVRHSLGDGWKGHSFNPFIFGTIACFKPQKNLFDLLLAFETAYRQNTHIRLEIIGDGEQRSAIETWIFEHKLNKVIALHGWQDHVALIMMHWHAFALTSLWEGLPCAIVEARLQKLPVISYNTGGIHDVITHGENGLLYPQKEWKEFANGMLEISRDQELYARLCEHRDELDDFKISSMIDEHANLYRGM